LSSFYLQSLHAYLQSKSRVARYQSNIAGSTLEDMKNKRAALNGPDLSGDRSMLIKPTKNMKKVIYALILPLVVVGGLVFANREIKMKLLKNRSQSHSLLLK
jgi:hypothetical protein